VPPSASPARWSTTRASRPSRPRGMRRQRCRGPPWLSVTTRDSTAGMAAKRSRAAPSETGTEVAAMPALAAAVSTGPWRAPGTESDAVGGAGAAGSGSCACPARSVCPANGAAPRVVVLARSTTATPITTARLATARRQVVLENRFRTKITRIQEKAEAGPGQTGRSAFTPSGCGSAPGVAADAGPGAFRSSRSRRPLRRALQPDARAHFRRRL
jgi:hypothetical protein